VQLEDSRRRPFRAGKWRMSSPPPGQVCLKAIGTLRHMRDRLRGPKGRVLVAGMVSSCTIEVVPVFDPVQQWRASPMVRVERLV